MGDMVVNPWNGKVVLEAFWWDCWNGNYPFDWYTYLAKLMPRLAALGFDGVWIPPPCKDTDAHRDMGYTPFDYYDLGQKNQRGAVGTRFGTQDALLRMIAVAHANGLEVYPDIVLDHCSGGDVDDSSPFKNDNTLQSTKFLPKGFVGPQAGRWPRNWLDFHENPQHWNRFGAWPQMTAGADFCYQGRCTDTGNGDQNCAARRNARAWLKWVVLQTGVDGFRFDDVKGFPPEVIEDVLFNAMGPGREYFAVGEFVTGSIGDIDGWTAETGNRCGTFDYPLHFALRQMVESGGFYDVGNLPSVQQQNRFKTVPFVNNHDTNDNQVSRYVDPDNPRTQLAYAVAIAMDGSPQLYYADLFRNVAPWIVSTTANAIPTRPWMENLVWCHQRLAFKSGDYFVRYQNGQQLLVLERGARAIVAINNDGSSWHSAWISTAFPSNTRLHDYSGSRPDDIWTNNDAWVEIAVPPLSYSIWGPAGVTGGFSPAPRRTVQQFEMDDDLGDSVPTSPGYGGKLVPTAFRSAGAIWPAAESRINVTIYSDTQQQVGFRIIAPDGTAGPLKSGTSDALVPMTLTFDIAAEGRYLLQAKLSQGGSLPARVYIKADYLGPAISRLF
jgi:alpha-amylase